MSKQVKKLEWSTLNALQIEKKDQRSLKGGTDDFIIIEDSVDC